MSGRSSGTTTLSLDLERSPVAAPDETTNVSCVRPEKANLAERRKQDPQSGVTGFGTSVHHS